MDIGQALIRVADFQAKSSPSSSSPLVTQNTSLSALSDQFLASEDWGVRSDRLSGDYR